MRFPHYIKSNEHREIPHHIIIVDTETNIKKGIDEFSQEQTFRLGFAVYLRMNNKTKSWIETEYPLHTINDFFKMLDEISVPKRKLFIFAHNASFDYAILKMDTYFSSRNYQVKMRVIDSVFIIKAMNKLPIGTMSITFSDTMNYYRMSLEKLGKIFGLAKMEKPDFENVDNDTLMTYCKQDTYVLVNLLKKHIDFIIVNDLGNFKLTIASQAFTAFTHRFMDKQILIHTYEDILDLELSSYRGGRCEAFKLGYFENIYKIDVNSMYPFVMKEYKYPIKPINNRCISGLTENDIKEEISKGNFILSNCKIILNEPAIAVKKEKLLFPIGKIIQTLTSPEIEYLHKNPNIGKIVEYNSTVIYEQSKLFKKYVDYFYAYKKSTTNDAYREMAKLLLNSLYGKFGQKSMSVQKIVDSEPLLQSILNEMSDLNTNSIIDLSKDIPVKYIKLGDILYSIEKATDRLANDSSPIIASTVTSYSRMFLFKLFKIAGFENTIYCDTDSLFVTEKGYINLKRKNLISPDELGKLKVEELGNTEIFGAKNYTFNQSIKLKGIKKDAIKIGENLYKQRQFITKNMRYKKAYPDGLIIVQPIIKKISMDYDKGIVKNGIIFPHQFNDF